ncbi:TetR family transcriptional regulator [Gammaproteobacteria bacterium]|jgi:AcrR family transcriptional regulator|nr:TetR family transcriptional regulator [Gammaproteobacteria bacterium]MDC0891527.1 TetR family transcriptional regulator [Gammaproteobacteria bacterium]
MSIDIFKIIMTKKDGRNLRSINSQKLIVDACIKLFKAGNLEPTAQQVADESGVGIRTVFRQFDEMENLFKSVDAVLSKDYDFEVRYDPSSSFDARLQSTISHMNAGYEKHKLIMFMTVSKMWKYEFLRKNYLMYQDLIKSKTEEILPEVLSFDTESRHLFHASLSFAMWTRLQGQKLNNDQINKAMFRQCILITNDNK